MRSRLRSRLEGAAARLVSKVVTVASDSYYGRLYYANRWHPRYAMLQDALDDTVSYIKSDMRDAVIRDDAFSVLTYALRHTRVDGLHLEFGVRSGSTIEHIAAARPRTTVYGFDSFDGLPEAWAGYTMGEGAFSGEGIPEVPANVELVVGWFDDTLPGFMEAQPGPVAFVHVDSDIYSSARTVLDHVGPRLRVGSVIVFNEYFNYPNWRQHEFRAWQECCAARHLRYEYLCWGLYEVAVRVTAVGAAQGSP